MAGNYPRSTERLRMRPLCNSTNLEQEDSYIDAGSAPILGVPALLRMVGFLQLFKRRLLLTMVAPGVLQYNRNTVYACRRTFM